MIDLFKELPLWMQALSGTIFSWFLTALGASVVFFFKKVNKTIMDLMLALASGVMIAASFWSLLAPAIEKAEELGMISWLTVAIGFISGGVLLIIGDYFISKYLKKLKNSKKDEQTKLKRNIMLVSSITLHNIPEGFHQYASLRKYSKIKE